ncbi:hypothetical protein [Cellulomonas aerilata]|uniref:Polysaccharide chain length determinant N-terminal domain-containing protein n=1 Tax=Cellulomonas aerilata TaxID=515326 RepID=A0A512DCH4_9CELL|nr:hypothetical protein [Cellulomonas aerilata]GEO34127.1 hypothetical protein CAE01nite_18520 [Cellulomonas aerilata]
MSWPLTRSEAEPEDTALRAWVGVLRRRALLVVLVAVICTAVAGVALSRAEARYTAAAQVDVSAALAGGGAPAGNAPRVADEALIARSTQVVQRVQEQLSFDVELDAAADEGSTVLTLSATAATPDRAAAAANAYADAYVDLRRSAAVEQSETAFRALTDAIDELDARLVTATEAQRTALREQRSALEEARTALVVDEALARQGWARVIAPAQPPLDDDALPGPLLLAGAALIGLALGLVAAAVRDALDGSAHTAESLARALVVPTGEGDGRRRVRVLAVVPNAGAAMVSAALRAGGAGVAAPLRLLRSTLLPTRRDAGPSVVHLTSTSTDDGAAVVACGLALALGASGHSTTLVEVTPAGADRVGPLLSLPPMAGPRDSVRPEGEMPEAHDLGWWGDDAEVAPRVRVLRVASGVGEGDGDGPAPLDKLVGDLRTTADVVVLLTPPLLSSPEGLEVALSVDSTALVVRLSGTPVSSARHAAALLAAVGGTVDGAVATGPEQTRTVVRPRPRRLLRGSGASVGAVGVDAVDDVEPADQEGRPAEDDADPADHDSRPAETGDPARR